MTTALAESPVMRKVTDLCEAILADPEYQSLMRKVDAFLDNDAARDQYQQATALGHELQHKQRQGVELGMAEIRDFEQHRDALFDNSLIREFLDAQRALGEMQSTVTGWIDKTIELGRLPEEHELENHGGGCCGGGGCGC